MKSNTNIRTEYCPMGLTKEGNWRPVTLGRLASKEQAENYLKEHQADVKRLPNVFTGYEAYKIAKHTVITTITEWEDA